MTLDQRIALSHARGRKPAHVIAAMPREQGRAVMWREIRRLRQFRLAELEHATRIGVETLRSYLQGLQRAGYLVMEREQPQAEGGAFLPATYRLERDCGIEPPRVNRQGRFFEQGTGRDRLWRSIRILKEFGLDELVGAASEGRPRPIAREAARDYLKHLHRAGYLRQVVIGAGKRAPRWRLVPARNSGPLPPQIQRLEHRTELDRPVHGTKQIFDANLKKVVWPEAQA